MRQVASARDMPWLRARLIEDTERRTARIVGAGGTEYGPAADQLVVTLKTASLYWVTADMTRVAADGATDIPEWTPASAAPDQSGILLWRADLPVVHPETVRGFGGVRRAETYRPRGVSWQMSGGTLTVDVITDWSRDVVGPHAVQVAPLAVVDTIQTPMWRSPRMDEEGWSTIREAGSLLALLGATWIMMQTPTVAERRTVEPARKDAEHAVRQQMSRPLVTTVDLRQLRRVDPDREPGASGRHLTVRHMVRGHWRQQWHPSDQSHRPKFIAPYIKGPEGAPLRLTEHVMVWRR